MTDHKKHPSGRPIRREYAKPRPMWRIPEDGFVTPRLNGKSHINAIGFTASDYQSSDEDFRYERPEIVMKDG